jgi:hypothetical protein
MTAAAHAGARGLPHKVALSSAPQMAAPETGGFNCGTYADGWREGYWKYHYYTAKKRDIAMGRSSALPATDFVYDDVWVVEDDGTILLNGTNAFDTPGTTFRFSPNGGGYDVAIPGALFDFDFGTDLGMGDDTESVQPLPFTFDYFGVGWNEMHIGSNGIIAFGANPNPAGFFDSNDFWGAAPKIAAFFMDLDPSAPASDGVYFRSAVDSVVITWFSIAEFNVGNKDNTFQVVLRADGTFDIRFGGIQSTTQSNGSPTTLGVHPGGATSPADRISFSGEIPYSGAPSTAVYEDYFNFSNPVVNETALFQKFYEAYPDSFFQLIFFTDFTQTMAGFANEQNLSNDVTGIGLGIFDSSSLYGSSGVLESRCNMNQLSVWFTDPEQRFANPKGNNFLTIMGQEAGHRWLAFTRFRDDGGQISNMILGRSDAHWSYYLDVDHSSMEGGDWDETGPGSYVCPGWVDFFSPYAEYMMGLRSADEVAPTFYVSSVSNDQEAARSVGTPPAGATAFGTPVSVTIEDIISAEGLRTPLVDEEEHDLRQAFILVINNGGTATQAELDQIAGFRRAWEPYFEYSCDGRLTVNTRLRQQWPVGVFRGRVVNRLTDEPVQNLTMVSVERGFNQVVPAGGRFMFRYQADELTGVEETQEIQISAPGFYPETKTMSVAYGTTLERDIELDPVPTSVEKHTQPLPDALYQNFPNPFNPTTSIPYDVSVRSRVTLAVYDVRGRLVRTLVDGVDAPGHKRVEWDGRDDRGRRVASGVYAFRVQIGGFVAARTMVLLK